MKPLEELTNAERAKLLYYLFPEEIPALLDFVRNMCATIIEGEEMNRRSWKPDSLITFDFWLSLVKDIAGRLEKYGSKLAQVGSLFADQLFDGYHSFFLAYCLHELTVKRKHANAKFSLAIELFFGY